MQSIEPSRKRCAAAGLHSRLAQSHPCELVQCCFGIDLFMVSLCICTCQPLQLETVALLQQKLQYEEQLHCLRQEVGSLQQRLKESVERASRVRQHAERSVMRPLLLAALVPLLCSNCVHSSSA